MSITPPDIHSYDPRTGEQQRGVASSTTPEQLDEMVASASSARRELAALGLEGRRDLLHAMADALEDAREELVTLAERETGLAPARLNGELTRTAYQLRFLADSAAEGWAFEPVIDHASDSPMGPLPDIRRLLLPVGPVAVFAASNFPFAFSVAGGDTASALAAGCPVIVKVHSGHPLTSLRQAEALRSAAITRSVTADVVQLVFGQASGRALVSHPGIRAAGFTGSLGAGRLLADLAAARPEPIPFYGELGALNPLVVTPGAAQARGPEIAAGLAESFTRGLGQFCTKPGLAFLPDTEEGDAIATLIATMAAEVPSGPMLNARTVASFTAGIDELRQHPGVTVLSAVDAAEASGAWVGPLVLACGIADVTGPALEECFGPVLLITRYRDRDELFAALDRLGGSLTFTIHAEPDDEELARPLLARAREKTGRIVWNGYPTGVGVTWGMHHGGPFPAALPSLHTSVGATSLRRWLRPLSFQDVPDWALPPELRDGSSALVRRVDGTMRIPTPAP